MYHYFIGDMELPLAPEKYTLRLPPANQTVRLADGRELNLLRPLGLREISFELKARCCGMGWRCSGRFTT